MSTLNEKDLRGNIRAAAAELARRCGKIVRPADVGLAPWAIRRLDPAPVEFVGLNGAPCFLLDDLVDKVGEGSS
jgi:hypothetical protein